MTRIYSALSNLKIKDLLNVLINQSSSPETYKETIFTLGLNLGDIILTQINNAQDEVCLACTVEDADFLAKGILARLESRLTRVALVCFWNQYFSPFDIEDLEVAPIIKRYQEPLVENIKYLVIAQSIISETCVIRTNLMNLNQEPRRKRTGYRSRFAPEPQIRIASPRASPQSSGEYVPYSIQIDRLVTLLLNLFEFSSN